MIVVHSNNQKKKKLFEKKIYRMQKKPQKIKI